MEGLPLMVVAQNTPKLELLVGGNLECISLNLYYILIQLLEIYDKTMLYHHVLKNTIF